MRLFWGERFTDFYAKAIDDVDHARQQQVLDDVHHDHDAHGRLLGRL